MLSVTCCSCIFVFWVWIATSAAQSEIEAGFDHGKIDLENLQRLEQQVINLTARLEELEEVTGAIEDEIDRSRMTTLEQKVAHLTSRLQILEEKYNDVTVTLANWPQPERYPIHNLNKAPLKSCKRILNEDGNAPSGLYRISPCGVEFTVYCNMEDNGGGWTVIQQRVDNSTNFYRKWEDYSEGFGNFETNFWLGLDKIHCLTQTEQCKLLVTISSFDGETVNSQYSHFKVGDKNSGYKLNVQGYNSSSSNAGDALKVHNGQKFTTQDQDNDKLLGENCAVRYHGAWWYNDCYTSNLNGRYYNKGITEISDGIMWRSFTGFMYSAKKVSMAIQCKT